MWWRFPEPKTGRDLRTLFEKPTLKNISHFFLFNDAQKSYDMSLKPDVFPTVLYFPLKYTV